MNRIFFWFKRHWLALAIAGSGILFVAWAGWQGYHTSQAQKTAEIVAPPTAAVGRGDVVLSVTAPGLSVSTNTRLLSARVAGSLDEILAQPGDTVKKDQPLVRIGDKERFTTAVSAAQLNILQAQKALDDLRANAPEATAQAQLALVQANKALDAAQRKRTAMKYPRASQSRLDSLESEYQANLQNLALAQEAFDTVASKPPDDPGRINAMRALVEAQQAKDTSLATLNFLRAKPSDADLAQTDAELAQAQAQQAKAQRDWDAVKDGPERMALEIAQANLTQAQSDLAKAQADLDSLEIRAPFDGIILGVAVQPGQTVTPGTMLVTLLDPKAMQVRATVVEEDLPLVKPGQPVNLFFDALPDANVAGTLDRIVPQRDSDAQAIYPIFITLDQLPEHLAAGMTVDASIVIAKQSNVLRLPRAVVHAHSDGTADVDVWRLGRVEHRTIQVGLRGDSFVEITSGLAEGEAVVAQ